MLDHANRYFQAVLHIQQQVIETQGAALARAVEIMLAAARAGGRIFIFGSGHSHLLAEEGHYRAGGLAVVVPILHSALMLHEGALLSTTLERQQGVAGPLLAAYQPDPRDCLLVISNSGVNAVPVEMALAAREVGMRVIVIQAAAYAAQAQVGAVGLKLADVAEVVIDNGGVPGDAVVPIAHAQGTLNAGPSSTVVGAFILNALWVEVAAQLAAGAEALPPIYISANAPGAAAHNQALVQAMRPKNPHL